MSVSERRSYLRAADRRDHILDCALEAFAKKGFHETSIADICALARIGRGTLYEYFADKDEVISALMDRIASRVIDAVRQWRRFEPAEAPWTADDATAFIEGRCGLIMNAVFADADSASLILRMARGSGLVRTTLARIDEEVVGAIATDLRAGMERGLLRALDADVTAQFIVGGIEKIVIGALDAGRAIDVARVAREMAVVVTCGLVANEALVPAAGPSAGGSTETGKR